MTQVNLNNSHSHSINIENLFLGIAEEDIDSEGIVKLKTGTVWAKNLISTVVKKDQKLLAVQDKYTKKYYIYSNI